MVNFKRPLILASNSPRRKQLLEDAGFSFTVKTKQVEENYPEDMPVLDIAKYLADKKAEALRDEIKDEIVIAADTVVACENKFLGKPDSYDDGVRILETLSNKMHLVITGVCLLGKNKKIIFDEITEVYFKPLTRKEIRYYLDHYQPYDKAGAYGIQEWLGLIGIKKIVGSYYNVVGLPVQKLYEALEKF